MFIRSRISDYFDGDSDQLDPRFAAFKRINWIYDYVDDYDYDSDKLYVTDNLELADRFSIKIDKLSINKYHFDDIRELYKDKDPNLMIEDLTINYDFESNWLAEDIEFINKLSPERLIIYGIMWTVEIIKTLTLINCANVYLENYGISININIYLWFENTPIQLFDSDSDQMFIFEWESIKILIEKDEDEDEFEKDRIEEVKLLKTNTDNFLFIPLDTIHQIEFLGFREISRADDINRQFADLDVQHQFKENGLIIPIGYSNRIFIQLYDGKLDYLNKYKDIYKIFKEKQIELKINKLDRLLKINESFPDDFTRINFEYYNHDKLIIEEYSISEIMDDLDWSNLKFKEIFQSSTLSPDGFQFWWMMLLSRRTRFNITSIYLKLSLLSECLTVLSLCLNCPELKSVNLRYEEEDIEYVDEVIENAQRQFGQKFGFIQKLYIWKDMKIMN